MFTDFAVPACSARVRQSRASTLIPALAIVSVRFSGYSAAPVITGAAEYPEDLEGTMTKAGIKVDALDCLTLAEQAGTAKSVNIVLMGRLSRYMDFSVDAWMAAIEKLVKPQFLEMNKKAFMLGRGE